MDIELESKNKNCQDNNESPTCGKDFIYVEDNNSDASADKKSLSSLTSSKKSLCSNGSSFADVQSIDYEPKMSNEHGEDVSRLVAEAQMEDFFPNYYAEEEANEDSKELRSQSDPDTSNTSDEDDLGIKRTSSEGHAKDACVLFHNITYLGSSTVNAPVSEIELRKAMSILRDHTQVSIDVLLSVGLNPHGDIRLIDPESRTDIATYSINKICFWGKGDSNNREKDCFAFNISHGKEETIYHCHVFKSEEEDDVSKIVQSLAQTVKKDKKRKQLAYPLKRGLSLDPNNLSFKFNITLDIWEEDGKGSFQTVSRDRNHFKLRKELHRKVVLIIEQVSNRKLKIERCFGLLLAQGKGVADQDLHLLQNVQTDQRPNGRVIISGHWDPSIEHWKLLNTDTGKDNRIPLTVAADIIFQDLKEPVRIFKEAKVRIFGSTEKFWNPSKPKIQEEYILQLKENFTELGEKYFEKESLQSATDIAKLKAFQNVSRNSSSSFWRSNQNKVPTERTISVDTEAEEIIGPDEEEEDEEPLLSGSGSVGQEHSDEELASWSDVLAKWKDLDSKPAKVLQLVRKGIPDVLRCQIWQMMAGLTEESELLNSYPYLTKKESPQEQVILWDVTRTFPAHEFFQEGGGQGQNALYNISKAYSVYDEEVGYCQGLSFLIAVFLLHVPEEQAYCLLVKIMYDYGHRDMFKDSFDSLHQSFYVLDHLMENSMQDLYLHLRAVNVEVHMFASQWFLTLFTAKFPLCLVYHIMDLILCEGCDVVFQVALALLKNSKKELLALDFEGILKYFRINLPKKYMVESNRKNLMNIAYSFKIPKKRLQKYKQEYYAMKEEMEMKEDPIVRMQRENQRLVEENLRLERENDSLAYEIVTTQVSMQEVITDREGKLNILTKEAEKHRKHLMEGEEEIGRLKIEEARVKDMWRGSMNTADEEKAKQARIIDDYKKILTRLEARNEKFKKDMEADLDILKRQLYSCESCTAALVKGLYKNDQTNDEASPQKNSLSSLLVKDDTEEQLRNLEAELIQTKVALAEEKNRGDEIEMRLHQYAAAAEKPWYKKVAINSKR